MSKYFKNILPQLPIARLIERYYPFTSEELIFLYQKKVSLAYISFNQEINWTPELIEKLEKKGQVYITSEKKLDKKYKKYQLKTPPQHIHHLLFYSELFIGDSQSMAFECAMLGTPSIRFSDFAGKISVLEELEHKYGLTYGIKPSEPEKLFEKIEELLSMTNLKEEFQKRRQRMLADKIDVTAFMVWFIENYPESVKIMQDNPNYQYNFK